MSRNFTFIQSIEPILYEKCAQAESLAKTYPELAGAKLRVALEYTLQWICHAKGFKASVTFEMINRVSAAGLLKEPHPGNLHKVRWLGNQSVHTNYQSTQEPSEVVGAINTATLITHLAYFHEALQAYIRSEYELSANVGAFNPDWIPIYGRQPIQLLPIEGEACQRKYLCESLNMKTGRRSYSVVKEFGRGSITEELGFTLRDLYALERRWDSDTIPQNIVRYTPNLEVQADNDLFFSCYELGSEIAGTLAQYNTKGLVKKDRLELLAGIAHGIWELHSNEDPIVHRFLLPSSVYLVPGKNGGLIPKISNFEYSKLEHPLGETMFEKVLAREDAFKAPEITMDMQRSHWPSVDIYSLGVMVLFLFDLNVTAVFKPEMLKRFGLSKAFCYMVARMLSPVPHERPSSLEALEGIQRECAR